MKLGYTFEDIGGTTTGKALQAKGLTRLWYVSMDNTVRFLVANLISVLCMVPAFLGIVYGLYADMAWALLLSGIVSGLLIGPATGCLTDAVLAGLRQESGRWWERYVRVLKRDGVHCLIPGLVFGLVLAMTANTLGNLYRTGTLPPLMLVSILVEILVCFTAGTYFWPMRMVLDLSMIQCLRNSFLMILMHPLVTLKALAAQLIYWAIMVILVPYSTPFLLIFGIWFPTLMAVNIIYDTFNQELKLEERLDNLFDQRLAEREQEEQ